MKRENRKILFKSISLRGYLSFFMNALQSVLNDLVFGLIYMLIFDYLYHDKIPSFVIITILIITAIYFVVGIALWGYLMEKDQNIYKGNLRKSVFNKIIDQKFDQNEEISQKITYLQSDTNTTNRIFGWDLCVLFQASFSGIVSSIIIISTSFKMFLILLITGLVAVCADVIFSKYLKDIHKKIRDIKKEKIRKINEYLQNMIMVRIFQIEEYENENISKVLDKEFKISKRLSFLRNSVGFVDDFIYSFVYKLIVFSMGISFVAKSDINFGQFLLIYAMIDGIIFFLSYTGGYIKNLAEISVSIKELDQFFENFKKQENLPISKALKSIEFKNMDFSYADKKVFENFTYDFDFTKDHLIIGDNGSGKSTLMNIMAGLIEISDKNIKYEFEENNKSAYVSQEALIFEDTLYNNIACGNLISKQNFLKALDTVSLSNWYETLEDREKFLLEENGKNISQGQKMRIALARALVKEPKVLFLDEVDANINASLIDELFKNIKKNYDLKIVLISHVSKNRLKDEFEVLDLNNC
ncbi:MAG: ABC transporter ATP-binding protein [Tissierellia bacterium]|nr:ABC transporter ATP-binding protein [Tissierellia bacterium]